jgi:hypothetical protein
MSKLPVTHLPPAGGNSGNLNFPLPLAGFPLSIDITLSFAYPFVILRLNEQENKVSPYFRLL